MQSAGSDSCSAGKMATSTQPNIWVKSFWLLRQAPRYCPLRPCALSGTSPVERFGFTVDGESDTYRKRDPVYSRDEVGRFSSTLAALLRVTGFTAERLKHSLYTSALPLLDIPPPHVSSVKWKSCPIKKRQPGADHGRTYANVDTVKYHTRRGGKISLRGKQIG